MFAKFSFTLQPAVSNSAAHGTTYLSSLGIRSKPRDVSCLFIVYLYQTIDYKVFQELRINLQANFYLLLLHFVANMVKTMFQWIFLSLIVTSCCKYVKRSIKLYFGSAFP